MGGNDFQCTQCGLLLDPQQASGEYVITEPTIVRALLSPPQRTRTMELPRPPPQRPTPHDLATARFTVPMDAHTVPHLRAGLDIALQPLHPFEAHIASFIDGDHAVPDLAQAARLPEIEVKVVLKALLERGVVELLERAVALEPNHPVFQQNLLKVTGLAAASPGPRKEEKRGLFARLTGRRS